MLRSVHGHAPEKIKTPNTKAAHGVAVQGDKIDAGLSTIFVCPVSSNLQDGLSLRPLIEVAPENGLRLRSQILTDKLVALRRDRIRRVIGRIDAETSAQPDRALHLVLGPAR
jgi:mRNA interferase MazF